jgi:hypothetical protein
MDRLLPLFAGLVMADVAAASVVAAVVVVLGLVDVVLLE